MGDIVVFELPLEGWISIGTLGFLLFFILWVASLIRIGKLKKRLNAFLKDTGAADLEGVIAKLHERTETLRAVSEHFERRIGALETKTESMKGNIGMLRYNPFDDRGGSDLSFSLAILDDRENGVVVSSLHSRDESRVYAKPLEAGASAYPLTPEEKEAIILAKRKSLSPSSGLRPQGELIRR